MIASVDSRNWARLQEGDIQPVRGGHAMAFLHFDTNRPAHFFSDWGVPIAAALIVGCWIGLLMWG
ncbi:hypothetical protein CYK37_18580 [Mesorhizobium loti]|nr:hypothetical protein CYK37_18580 [Mesorhizobium loti]